MTVQTLEDLFVLELSDIYSAEKQLTKALPKMAKAATNEKLAQAFEDHLAETEDQVARIEKIVEICNLKIKRRKCAAMEALIAEGNSTIEELEEGAIRDMGLVSAAQKVEHYEIAAYLHLMQLAKHIGDKKAFKLLDETLSEEEGADDKLSDICDEVWNEADNDDEQQAA